MEDVMIEHRPDTWREAIELAEKLHKALNHLPDHEGDAPEDLNFLRYAVKEAIEIWLDTEVLALE
jgi:hypothetical protein